MATKSRLRVSAPALAVMSAAAALYPLRLPAGHMMSARAPRAIARRRAHTARRLRSGGGGSDTSFPATFSYVPPPSRYYCRRRRKILNQECKSSAGSLSLSLSLSLVSSAKWRACSVFSLAVSHASTRAPPTPTDGRRRGRRERERDHHMSYA